MMGKHGGQDQMRLIHAEGGEPVPHRALAKNPGGQMLVPYLLITSTGNRRLKSFVGLPYVMQQCPNS